MILPIKSQERFHCGASYTIPEKENVIKLLEEEMQGAAELLVPLEVGTEFGYNWYDAH